MVKTQRSRKGKKTTVAAQQKYAARADHKAKAKARITLVATAKKPLFLTRYEPE